jgi:hypothetical protein
MIQMAVGTSEEADSLAQTEAEPLPCPQPIRSLLKIRTIRTKTLPKPRENGL